MFKFRLTAYLSVHAFHLFGNASLLFRSYFTLSNAMQITSPLLVRRNKGVRIGIYLYSHFVIWKKLIFWRTFIFARLIFAWSFIFADANFAIFCILRRFISKDVCSVIIVAKRQNRNLCKLSKELKLELRKVTLFMRDLSAANQTAIISFLRTFLFVFMIRLGSNVNWVVFRGEGGGWGCWGAIGYIK